MADSPVVVFVSFISNHVLRSHYMIESSRNFKMQFTWDVFQFCIKVVIYGRELFEIKIRNTLEILVHNLK